MSENKTMITDTATAANEVGDQRLVLPIEDTFNGDTAHLCRCIEALIRLNDDDALAPHGIGGHARNLLAAAYHRLRQNASEIPPD
jgi:hypothetical protein